MTNIRYYLLIFLCVITKTVCSGEPGPNIKTFVTHPYLGISGGLGDIESSRKPFIIKSALINQIKGQSTFLGLLSVDPKSSGLSGRIYTGVVTELPWALDFGLGAEIGYSHYATSTVTSNETIAYETYVNFTYNDKTTNEGYGVDLLLNTSYSYQNITVNLKPGVQYAIQNGITYAHLNADTENTNFNLPLRDAKFKLSNVVPELIFQAKWQLLPTNPLFLGLSYQYVWGKKPDDSQDGLFDQVNIRKMATIDLEYKFG